jgi:hypothetical protein
MASSRELPSDCKLEELEEYKKTLQRLSEPIIYNNGRTYKYSDIDVNYGRKTFYINFLDFSTYDYASVTSITSYTSNEINEIDEVTCTGYRDENLIVVDRVNMEKTIGKGNCTKAVAYLIKTLMLKAKKGNLFPHEGTVYVSSKNACSAANCYIKAFMLNGFDYDKEELKEFQDKVINRNVDYELNFKNKKQEQEQKRITTTTRKRKRELLHKELLNLQRIKELKF